VLLCGDADFSYAAALVSHLDSTVEVTATAYEDETDLLARYPYAAATLEKLSAAGTRLCFGVDARSLRRHFPTDTWDRVVFNLPQSPPQLKARNQIQRHRALLRDFCESATSVLSPNGQIWVTLLAGQGGTPVDPIQRPKGNTWQVQAAAANAGLLVVAVLEVEMQELGAAGYQPGGRGVQRGAKISDFRQEQGLLTHVLVREKDQIDLPLHAAACACRATGAPVAARSEVGTMISSEEEGISCEDEKIGREHERMGYEREMMGRKSEMLEAGTATGVPLFFEARGVASVEWAFDNSFWMDTEHPLTELELEIFIRGSLGEEGEVLRGPPYLFDVWESLEGRRARTYTFTYSSSRLALSRERALGINGRVCEAIVAMGNIESRIPAEEASGAASSGQRKEGDDGAMGDIESRITADGAPGAHSSARKRESDNEVASVGRAGDAAMSMVVEGAVGQPELSVRSNADCCADCVISAPDAAAALRAPMCGGRWRQSDD
jgi:hypothetical protein